MRGHGRTHPKASSRAPGARGFDFSGAIRQLCQHACGSVQEIAHIDMHYVAVGFRQARKAVSHGLQASLTPMRFEGGTTESVRRGRRWTTQRIIGPAGQDILYLLNFYLPRFLDLPFEEKLTTIFHELWHVGPEFDGDLRRHEGRCYMHGPRQDDFDDVARRIAECWMSQHPPRQLWEFLRLDFADLQANYGRVYGERYPAPKLIPIQRA